MIVSNGWIWIANEGVSTCILDNQMELDFILIILLVILEGLNCLLNLLINIRLVFFSFILLNAEIVNENL